MKLFDSVSELQYLTVRDLTREQKEADDVSTSSTEATCFFFAARELLKNGRCDLLALPLFLFRGCTKFFKLLAYGEAMQMRAASAP